jgi:hypothetical protein
VLELDKPNRTEQALQTYNYHSREQQTDCCLSDFAAFASLSVLMGCGTLPSLRHS